MSWRQAWGLLKSRAIYYWKPGNQRAMQRFYSPFISPGDLCFDIGAHLGNRIAAWRALGAQVVAVEPQAACLAFMRKKFKADEQVTLIDGAVARQSGTATLYINPSSPSISTLRDSEWRHKMAALSTGKELWDITETVKTYTLEDLVTTYGIPRFCKLDIEGFELEAILGLSTPLPHLSFEFLNPGLENVPSILETLEKLGNYRYQYSLRERHVFELTHPVTKDQILDELNKLGSQVISGDIYAQIRP